MLRRLPPRQLSGARRSSAPRRSRRPACLGFEPLEARLMLDIGIGSTTPPIVVGRTLSSYTVGGIQDGKETLTYTVYNETADSETGVLLTTTLGPGVTFQGASQQPDRNGQ